nr:harbinger transposase-derived nuclease domain-containing protein [Tanacetum cinerariifolium]
GSDPEAKYALSKLLQMGIVAKYQNEFEMIINRVTGIPQSLLIPSYISGLKLHLQRELNLVSRSTMLGDVFSLARIIEARFEDTNNQAVDNNGRDKKDHNMKDKQEVKKADDQELKNVKDEECKNVKDQHVSEKTINETAYTITSLQSKVASLDEKGSLDANEEIKKDHTRVHELEKQVQQSIDVESTYDNDAQDQVSKLEMKVLVDGKQDEAKVVKLVVVAVKQNIDKPYVEGNGVKGVGVHKNNKGVQYSVSTPHALILHLERLNDQYIKKKKIEAAIQRRI